MCDNTKPLPGEKIEVEENSIIKRRTFMKLPIEERRRILAEQTDKIAATYNEDNSWKETQGEEIIEY